MDDLLMGTLILGMATATALALAFWGRTRLPRWLVLGGLAVCGAGIGWGAGGMERHLAAGPLDTTAQGRQWLAAVILLAVLTPFHARVVLGPLGRRE